jgi:ferrous-iron efflux pump FieF
LAAVALVVMQTWVVTKTGSVAIAADRAHYMTDIVNAGVLLALGITKVTGWTRADAAIGLVISFYIIWNAVQLVRQVLVNLLDRELPDDERQQIKRAISACPGVRGFHDLRSRNAGDRRFVEFHLEVHRTLTMANRSKG